MAHKSSPTYPTYKAPKTIATNPRAHGTRGEAAKMHPAGKKGK